MKWTATYYASARAKPTPARVAVERSGLTVEVDGRQLSWPYEQIRQTQGFAPGETVRLLCGEQILLVPDRGILLHTCRYAPHLRQTVADEVHLRAAVIYGLMVSCLLVVVGAAFFVLIPELAGVAARLLPLAAEERLGMAAAAQLASRQAVCTDGQLMDALNRIVERLSFAARPHPYRFRVSVVDTPEVNALAAPGGFVMIYRGLLERSAQADELAGVLAHEMEHVLSRHSVRGLLREAGTWALIGLVMGDASQMAGLAASLGSLRFQREDEVEADVRGFELVVDAGFDPQAMIRMYRQLGAGAAQIPAFLSTHPNLEDRIRLLERLAEAEARPSGGARLINDWPAVRRRCR